MSVIFNNVIFETTQKCNLACRYCYNAWHAFPKLLHKDEGGSRQTFQTLKKIIGKIRPAHITFTGGEPFLEKKLKEMALYCRMKKTAVSIISNGTAGTGDDYADLAQLGIQHFQFPLLSSFPALHDELTAVAGSWDKAKHSLAHTTKRWGNAVAVFVATGKNYRECGRTIALLRELGVKRLMLARFNIGGRGIKYRKELALSKAMLREVFEQAQEASAAKLMRISSNVCLPLCIIDPAQYPDIRISTCSPDVKHRPVTIDSKGNIRVCNHSPVVIGNIFQKHFMENLDFSYLRKWESDRPNHCNNCAKWEKCRGGCRAASEQMGKTLESEDPAIKLADAA